MLFSIKQTLKQLLRNPKCIHLCFLSIYRIDLHQFELPNITPNHPENTRMHFPPQPKPTSHSPHTSPLQNTLSISHRISLVIMHTNIHPCFSTLRIFMYTRILYMYYPRTTPKHIVPINRNAYIRSWLRNTHTECIYYVRQ